MGLYLGKYVKLQDQNLLAWYHWNQVNPEFEEIHIYQSNR